MADMALAFRMYTEDFRLRDLPFSKAQAKSVRKCLATLATST
jgi:hypothetical protein